MMQQQQQEDEDFPYDALTTAFASSYYSLDSPKYMNSDVSCIPSFFQYSSPGDTNACSVLQYQQLYNRYKLCVAMLHESIEKVDALRRDNESLRLSNADLSRRIALFSPHDHQFGELSNLNIQSPSALDPLVSHQIEIRSPVKWSSTKEISLPKSISVRSSGYHKILRSDLQTTGRKAEDQSVPTAQRVYLPAGSKKEEVVMELDVYNQGMLKTELCNKWQETETCPYGKNCQFAHGLKELRAVIRHPRYKTEVCRMVMAGDVCPYGHRCHFRHSLTEEEKLMAVATPSPR